MAKVLRKYLAHFIDASFGSGTATYVRLGKDLEEYNEELNPDVTVIKNILGEQSVEHNGYSAQSAVNPFYAEFGDALFEKLATIVNTRANGDECKTTKVDVLFNTDGTVEWAYREDVMVVPTAIGGGANGVQIPFTIYNDGNRVEGTWDKATNKFTPNT